ncbi:NAD(P)H-quinone oxidoreductase subunit N [Candidatus Cyanaurora vandensis]|uniref:NAD(P)H-quinone oxidoreductase subunit N n=1 Tax=Candidatus Cyanaurora vandensis TaxID=2714958 RepID=UPI00257DD191|nr:NAD(P)H-quinone oxidoreductase subunit N [Candidatus Cyanaurora vandensis]
MYPIVTDGKEFVAELTQVGAMALWAPPEGGFEGNYQRRMREAGYTSLHMSARGLGDPARYLTQTHEVRPAHLGKKSTMVFAFPPLIQTHLASVPPKYKGLLLWLIEGKVLAAQELEYLVELTQQEPRLKIVIEMGSDRKVRWQPLLKLLQERGF